MKICTCLFGLSDFKFTLRSFMLVEQISKYLPGTAETKNRSKIRYSALYAREFYLLIRDQVLFEDHKFILSYHMFSQDSYVKHVQQQTKDSQSVAESVPSSQDIAASESSFSSSCVASSSLFSRSRRRLFVLSRVTTTPLALTPHSSNDRLITSGMVVHGSFLIQFLLFEQFRVFLKRCMLYVQQPSQQNIY